MKEKLIKYFGNDKIFLKKEMVLDEKKIKQYWYKWLKEIYLIIQKDERKMNVNIFLRLRLENEKRILKW